MKWRPAPPELVRRFERAMESVPEATVGKMFRYPAGFVSGQMFTGLFQHAMILRLSADDRAALLKQP